MPAFTIHNNDNDDGSKHRQYNLAARTANTRQVKQHAELADWLCFRQWWQSRRAKKISSRTLATSQLPSRAGCVGTPKILLAGTGKRLWPKGNGYSPLSFPSIEPWKAPSMFSSLTPSVSFPVSCCMATPSRRGGCGWSRGGSEIGTGTCWRGA